MTTSTTRADRDDQHDSEGSETALPAVLVRRAREMGATPALVDGQSGRTLTYEKLAADVERIATTLADRGFERGAVLAVYSPGLNESVVVSLAATLLGGTSTLATPRATVEELTEQLEATNARYLVTVPPFFDPAMGAAHRTGVEEVLVFGDAVTATEHEGVTVTPLC